MPWPVRSDGRDAANGSSERDADGSEERKRSPSRSVRGSSGRVSGPIKLEIGFLYIEHAPVLPPTKDRLACVGRQESTAGTIGDRMDSNLTAYKRLLKKYRKNKSYLRIIGREPYVDEWGYTPPHMPQAAEITALDPEEMDEEARASGGAHTAGGDRHWR